MRRSRLFVGSQVSSWIGTVPLNRSIPTGEVPTSGLVAYYSLNGNANDTISSANFTTQQITWGTGRKSTQAAEFNGSSSWLYRQNTTYGLTGNGARSISMWVYLNSAKNGQRQLLFGSGSFGNNLENFDFEANVYENGGPVGFYGMHWWGNGARFTGAVPTYNQWNHCVVVHDGGSLTSANTRLYVNNQSPFTFSGNTNFNIVAGSMIQIGAREYAPFTATIDDLQLQGSLDEIRVYNRALTASEVAQLYFYDL